MQAGLAAKDPVAFVAGEQRKLLVAEGKPFVFVNVVLSDSQAFVPVLDMVRALWLFMSPSPQFGNTFHYAGGVTSINVCRLTFSLLPLPL